MSIDTISNYTYSGRFDHLEDCLNPDYGQVIATFVYNGSSWGELPTTIAMTDRTHCYDVVDRCYPEHEQKMIPVSTCRYCGAPVNNDGECEYCGIKHQYILT